MKVFIDANVLISVLNKEYPLFTFSSRILSLVDSRRYELYTSSLCLAIGFYFSSKKSGEQLAKKKIGMLYENLLLAQINGDAVKKSLQDPRINDLEDGFQYFAALEAGCQCIVTENGKDYYFSEIEVLNSEDFFTKYVLNLD